MRGKGVFKKWSGNAGGITPAYAGKSSHVLMLLHFLLDHPRLCGEKFRRFHANSLLTRITPAYAGKSILIGYGKFFLWDHPRLCGEKQNGFPLAVGGVGSPPPMRGKEWTFQRSHGRCRITPAYAGKSKIVQHFGVTTEDHPRLCGEKQFIRHPLEHELGSPPPMRGKVQRKLVNFTMHRIPPAYAGKRIPIVFTSLSLKDHPRLCGEKRTSQM